MLNLKNEMQQPLRIQLKKVCELLDISRDTLRQLICIDPTFPKPIKAGTSKQSSVYFDYADLLKWHNNQKQSSSEKEV